MFSGSIEKNISRIIVNLYTVCTRLICVHDIKKISFELIKICSFERDDWLIINL